MTDQPKQIQAIDLIKSVFEHINGNLALLRFTIEKMTPVNGVPDNTNADKWEAIVSFYQTLSSQQPTKYQVDIQISEKLVSFCPLEGDTKVKEKTKAYKVVEDNSSESKK